MNPLVGGFAAAAASLPPRSDLHRAAAARIKQPGGPPENSERARDQANKCQEPYG